MRRFLLTTAAVTTTLLGAACGDSTGLNSNVAGSYELQTINGQSLPVQAGSDDIESGEIEIDADGRFVEIVRIRQFNGQVTPDVFTGSWERDGDEIIFDYDDGNTFVARRTSSSRFILDVNGDDWAYRRF
jgi:hypothetical protein